MRLLAASRAAIGRAIAWVRPTRPLAPPDFGKRVEEAVADREIDRDLADRVDNYFAAFEGEASKPAIESLLRDGVDPGIVPARAIDSLHKTKIVGAGLRKRIEDWLAAHHQIINQVSVHTVAEDEKSVVTLIDEGSRASFVMEHAAGDNVLGDHLFTAIGRIRDRQLARRNPESLKGPPSPTGMMSEEEFFRQMRG